MSWKQIVHPEEPGWQEWHKELMSPSRGRIMLKIWFNAYNGYWRASANYSTGAHASTSFETVTDGDEAKRLAVDWAMGITCNVEGARGA